MLVVLNNFIKNRSVIKSSDLKSGYLRGQVSRPYIGIHFSWMSCRITSSETILPIFPKLLFAVRWNEHFA